MDDNVLFDDEIFDISSESEASDSSDDDENLELILDIDLRHKNAHYLDQTIPQYSNELFLDHFRVSRHVAMSIADKFANSIYYSTNRSGCYGKLSAQDVIYIFLWFAGHQTASYRDVGDRFDVTISTIFRIIRRVTYFLSNLSPEVITWPTQLEKEDIAAHFNRKGFPGVIGAIDGSHIKIDKPSDDPDSYMNRKSFYSIQIQTVCDHNLLIRDIFVGFPGSVHDSRVFRNSTLCATLQQKCVNFHLLGDSGYPLLTNLLTPFRDRGQLSRAQTNYNVALATNRYIIEHCFGLLKQKYRQLYHVKLRNVRDIVHFIRACCVLHNLALKDDVPLNQNDIGHQNEVVLGDLWDNNDEDPDEIPDDRNGVQKRNDIVNILNIRCIHIRQSKNVCNGSGKTV
ncbi:putative nuclease HARBI1 [Sitophilus oryzae]|uniref:Nuclease HARBI1 n=1 Tax=Sitophilus oryzae TaxID=7048 RepID=A0A6J2X1Q0_SITOR|nr:putative nuclease HARBI1 [Sitophilus oryzae]